MEDYELINIKLPDKGKDILGIDQSGNEYYCFRCSCINTMCLEWRCSLTGFGLEINIIKWKYV